MLSVFSRRPGRARLIERAAKQLGWDARSRLLEFGCGYGDAAADLVFGLGCRVEGLELDAAVAAEAKARHSGVHGLKITCGDVCAPPYPDASFTAAYGEAAFSVLPDKAAALAGLCRVIIGGGELVINDFALKSEPETRDNVRGVPCFEGVQSLETYCALLDAAGFDVLSAEEEPAELALIAMWCAREYGVKASELGEYLAKSFGGGGEGFFSTAKMTYCQIISRKREER